MQLTRIQAWALGTAVSTGLAGEVGQGGENHGPMQVKTTPDELFDTFLHLPVPMYATDREGHVHLWNRALQDLTGVERPHGRKAGEVLNMAQDFTPLWGDNPVLDEVLQTGQRVERVNCGLSIHTAAGERAIDFTGEPLVDVDQSTWGAIAVLRDATRERTLEKALDGMERTAGHDLRNAVGVLEGYLPLLTSGEVARMDDGGLAIFQTLMRTSRLLQSIINLMLTTTRYCRTLIKEREESLLLSELFMTATRALEPTAANKDISFAPQVPGDLVVMGQEDLLQAAMSNLLYAATKLARNRTVVQLVGKREHGRGSVELIFAARAIDPDELTRMLSPMGEPQDPRLGVGMSLCLSRMILGAHGSELVVTQPASDSTAFTFSLREKHP